MRARVALIALTLVVLVGGIGAVIAATAGATTNPTAQVVLECEEHDGQRHVHANFIYSGFSPQNNLVAEQVVEVASGPTVVSSFHFSGPGGTDSLTVPLNGDGEFHVMAETVVRGGAGRVKATGSDHVICEGEDTPPPTTTDEEPPPTTTDEEPPEEPTPDEPPTEEHPPLAPPEMYDEGKRRGCPEDFVWDDRIQDCAIPGLW